MRTVPGISAVAAVLLIVSAFSAVTSNELNRGRWSLLFSSKTAAYLVSRTASCVPAPTSPKNAIRVRWILKFLVRVSFFVLQHAVRWWECNWTFLKAGEDIVRTALVRKLVVSNELFQLTFSDQLFCIFELWLCSMLTKV